MFSRLLQCWWMVTFDPTPTHPPNPNLSSCVFLIPVPVACIESGDRHAGQNKAPKQMEGRQLDRATGMEVGQTREKTNSAPLEWSLKIWPSSRARMEAEGLQRSG